MVLVYFLGTAGAGGIPGRAKNGVLVDTGSERILLDCGPGTVERLVELGFSACDVDYVFVSHVHLDHWVGLFDYATRYSVEGCGKPPVLVVSDTLKDDARRIIEVLPGSLKSDITVKLAAVGLKVSLKRGTLTLLPGEHTVPSYGVVLEADDATIVYSSDTKPTSQLREAAARADLLIVEASMPHNAVELAAKTGHHTVDQAASYRDTVKPGGILVLTHLTLESLDSIVRRGAPRGAIVASDGLSISV